jgi:hypothetical protein
VRALTVALAARSASIAFEGRPRRLICRDICYPCFGVSFKLMKNGQEVNSDSITTVVSLMPPV